MNTARPKIKTYIHWCAHEVSTSLWVKQILPAHIFSNYFLRVWTKLPGCWLFSRSKGSDQSWIIFREKSSFHRFRSVCWGIASSCWGRHPRRPENHILTPPSRTGQPGTRGGDALPMGAAASRCDMTICHEARVNWNGHCHCHHCYDKGILGVSEDVRLCGVGKMGKSFAAVFGSTHSPCDHHTAALHAVEQKACPALEVLPSIQLWAQGCAFDQL